MAGRGTGRLGENNMSEGPLIDLLVDGIIGGVGGVMVFLPTILLLYFFISLMEYSGCLLSVNLKAIFASISKIYLFIWSFRRALSWR